MDDIISARSLAQRHGRRWVFRDLTFDVPSGIVGLLGPNGAGKSTLMSTICTLKRPAGGTLLVLGHDVSHPHDGRQLRRSLGYLPQSFGFFPNFTVQEFVEYAAWLKLVPRDQIRGKALAAIDDVGLSDRTSSAMRTLSGGMLRRAGIAQAVVHDPDLLILDEPTAGLDPEQRVELRNLVRRLGKRSTVLLSTHLVEDVRAVCDNLLILREGRSIFTGTPTELIDAAVSDAVGDSDIERGYATVLANASTAAA